MIIRPAGLADAAVLGPLHVESWQAAYAHLLPASFLESIDPEARTTRFSEVISEGRTVLVADDGEIHGFCSLGPSRDFEGWGEVYAIYLRPASWGRGLGSRLMSEAHSRLAASGFSEAMLWVLDGNTRARAFYESAGWRPGVERQVLEWGGTRLEELVYERRLIATPDPDHSDR